MIFGREDLSQYNSAKRPACVVEGNGKVDFIVEPDHPQKIGLTSVGMFKVVTEWLDTHHGLSREQKEELISKLQK